MDLLPPDSARRRTARARLALLLWCILWIVLGSTPASASMVVQLGLSAHAGDFLVQSPGIAGLQNRIICGNDPVNRHDPLGLADRASVFDVLCPALASGFHGSPYGSQRAAIRRSTAVRVPILQAAAAAGNTARTVGGAFEMFAGVAYSGATGGAGGVFGGGVLWLNGLDNFNAGWNSLATDSYQPAVLERGITSVAGNGVIGNGIYIASQFGIGFGAPTLGSRVNSLLESDKELSMEMSQGLMPLRELKAEVGAITIGTPASTNRLPLGFSSAEQFSQAGRELTEALQASGLKVNQVGVRGSAVTNVSSKGGPFRFTAKEGMKPSDIDFFFELADDISLNASGKIPGLIHPDKLSRAFSPLRTWTEKWTKALGREVTPGGFKPGTFTDPDVLNF